jgi:hypothetical protein
MTGVIGGEMWRRRSAMKYGSSRENKLSGITKAKKAHGET